MIQRVHFFANIFITILLLFFSLHILQGQPGGLQAKDNIRWSYEVKHAAGAEFDLIFKADLDPKWHLYGPYQEYEFGAGPLPMEIEYDSKSSFTTVGRIRSSPRPERVFDDIYEVYINQFEGRPTFTQRIRVNTETPFTIRGTISGQICLDVCIPFEENFSLQIKGASLAGEAVALPADGDQEDHNDDESAKEDELAVSDQEQQVADTEADDKQKGQQGHRNLLIFFLVAVGIGVVGIFTPCVFPMIPMNIAFFLNYRGGKTKGKFLAVFYGLSIIFIYSVLGLVITVIFGPEALGNIVNHWLTNVIFFLIFVVFAASFFGAFEIMLPSKWVNKADSQVDRGGLIGTFFMALTLVLVSFSCTAAFIGGILMEAAADGTSLLKPFIGMLGFSIGFGVPFAFLALFPAALSKMPKSGGWMNSVKVVFGFIIIAFGMKFLIVPDQTYHLGILTRDIYIAIWIVLFTLMGIYLMGKIKFSHDSDLKNIGFFRLLLIVATFSFVVYLIPGLFGADLKGISGLLPPKSSQQFDITQTHGTLPASTDKDLCGVPSYTDFLHFPHDLKGYFDLNEAIECAKEKNKPIFIDFTGHGCANCKVMEATVWSDPRVLERFRNEFIMVALYTDDRKTLPESKWVETPDGNVLKTIGRINRHIQQTRFGTLATPLYVVIDHDANMLSGTWQTSKDIDGFIAFLDDGIKKFRISNP